MCRNNCNNALRIGAVSSDSSLINNGGITGGYGDSADIGGHGGCGVEVTGGSSLVNYVTIIGGSAGRAYYHLGGAGAGVDLVSGTMLNEGSIFGGSDYFAENGGFGFYGEYSTNSNGGSGGAAITVGSGASLTTSIVIVERWAVDRCTQTDTPDAPPRAFRDLRGRVHLFATHDHNRSLTDPISNI